MPIKKYQQFQLILDSKLQRLSNTRSPHPELSSLGNYLPNSRPVLFLGPVQILFMGLFTKLHQPKATQHKKNKHHFPI